MPKTKSKRTKRSTNSTSFKIEAKPLTEEQIALFVKHYKQHKNFPGFKIPCSVTGKLTTCVGPWMKKKIAEFGSPENLLRNYKSRGALKQERVAAKPVVKRLRRERKPKKNPEEMVHRVPIVNGLVRVPFDSSDITNMTKSQCFRPDLYLDNKRNCEGCNFYENCTCRLRALPLGVKFADGRFQAA